MSRFQKIEAFCVVVPVPAEKPMNGRSMVVRAEELPRPITIMALGWKVRPEICVTV